MLISPDKKRALVGEHGPPWKHAVWATDRDAPRMLRPEQLVSAKLSGPGVATRLRAAPRRQDTRGHARCFVRDRGVFASWLRDAVSRESGVALVRRMAQR